MCSGALANTEEALTECTRVICTIQKSPRPSGMSVAYPGNKHLTKSGSPRVGIEPTPFAESYHVTIPTRPTSLYHQKMSGDHIPLSCIYSAGQISTYPIVRIPSVCRLSQWSIVRHAHIPPRLVDTSTRTCAHALPICIIHHHAE